MHRKVGNQLPPYCSFVVFHASSVHYFFKKGLMCMFIIMCGMVWMINYMITVKGTMNKQTALILPQSGNK